jgi:hypothetical protein
MIKLTEILHTIRDEAKAGLTDIDNWSIVDADFMLDMGFKPNGHTHYSLTNPKITVCHKQGEGFILDDKTKGEKKTFPKFNDLAEYFTTYEQKWENSPYQS